MKAWEIKDTFSIDGLTLSERPDPALPPGHLRIRVKAVSLNYRDLVTVKFGGARQVKQPLIPCSDGAGEPVSTTSPAISSPSISPRLSAARLTGCLLMVWCCMKTASYVSLTT